MNRIDRYTLTQFWSFCLAGLLVVVTLFVAIDAMTLMGDFKDVSVETLLRYYLHATPETMQKMLPVATLMGCVFTLSSLQSHNELTALFSVGMSLFRVMLPSLVSVVFLCFFSLYLADRILPPLAKEKNRIYYNEMKKTMFSTTKTDKIWYKSKNAIFYIKTMNIEGTKAQGLNLYFFDETFNLLQMLAAKEVDLNGPQWVLRNGTITLFSKESSFPLTNTFRTKTIVMSEDAGDLQSSGQTSEMLTQAELKEFIDRNSQAGLNVIPYEVDFHSKFSFAFAGLVMSLLGIPVSVRRARSGGLMVNAGVCLALVFSYWILYNSSLTLGNHGQLQPWLAAWSANAGFLLVGLFLFWRVRR